MTKVKKQKQPQTPHSTLNNIANVQQSSPPSGSHSSLNGTLSHSIPQQPIDEYHPVIAPSIQLSQADIDIFTYKMDASKVYGVSLFNQQGKFVFVSKVAHQQFEGSLNNFQSKSFYDMIIKFQREQIKKKVLETKEISVINYLIYSKNTKRRYTSADYQPKEITNQFIFYRYLKVLLSSVRLVQVTFKNPQQCIQGFWNSQLIKPNQPQIFYLLHTKLGQNPPNLADLPLEGDPIITKYLAHKPKENKRSQNSLDIISHYLTDNSPKEKKIRKKPKLKKIKVNCETATKLSKEDIFKDEEQ